MVPIAKRPDFGPFAIWLNPFDNSTDNGIINRVGNEQRNNETRVETMNHNEYPKTLRNKSEAELRFIVRDCQEALEANPTSAKASDYADEILYVAAELNRRK